jgi:hypothetical protein
LSTAFPETGSIAPVESKLALTPAREDATYNAVPAMS